MFLNFVFVLVYIARIYILYSFTNEKVELTILTTKHSLLASYTTWKVCFYGIQWICRATNRKIYFLTTDLWVIMAICRATQKICSLSTTHGHLPLRATKRSFLMTQASGSKYVQLCWNHTHILWIYTANMWLRAWAHNVICPCCRRPNQPTNLSQKFSWQTGLGLHYTVWTQ